MGCPGAAAGWWVRGLAPHERAGPGPHESPAWVRAVERAMVSPAATGEVPADWRDAFAMPLRSLVADTTNCLVERAAGVLTAGEADLDGVADSFGAWLRRRLVATAARTFVSRLHEQRTGGRLRGTHARERFADFVRDLARPCELTALLDRYPVLARLLGETCGFAGEAMAELLTRFAADRTAIVAQLLGGVDPGPVVAVRPGLGDLHQHGRSVTKLRFADGRLVVYRPRDVRVYGRLTALVARLNQVVPGLDLRTVDAVARDGYGWLAHVRHRPMTDPCQVDRFYRRQGALLALLYVLDGTDMHCDNLIACGEWPVLVDVETLFHPYLPQPGGRQDDPAVRALASSVHRTALLPFLVVGDAGVLDMSALGGGTGEPPPSNVVGWEFPGTDRMRLVRRITRDAEARNQPRLDGATIELGDHEPALREGFHLAYDAVLARRGEFAEHIGSYADLELRVVVRPTREYAALLDESTHPDLLRDARDRDRVLDALRQDSAGDPLRGGLVRHELADLWAGDVPLFHTRPGSRDLWTATGTRLPDRLEATGVDRALSKLDGMCAADRRDQEWIIAATLATRRAGTSPHSARDPMPGPVTGTLVQPQRLLTAACAIADRIVAGGLTGDHGRVNWLGLELVDERQWVVLPMGGGLATGYLGVALFLAQLARLSGVARYADTARAAIAPLPTLLDTLTERADLVALVGAGGLRGLGGIAYGLSRLATLLDDPDLRAWTRTAVTLAASAPHRPGWADGSAGCLAAMVAVHAEQGFPEAARLAAACAEHTAGVVAAAGIGPAGTGVAGTEWAGIGRVGAEQAGIGRAGVGQAGTGPAGTGSPGTVPAGFADGWAGIAWALTRCAPGDPHYRAAARAALDRVPRNAGEDGWCGGAAGGLIARLGLGDVDPDRVRVALADRPVLRDLSLCHGELGVAEALAVLAGVAPGKDTALVVRRRAGMVLGAIDRYGLLCGTPGGVSTPGLLNGLAGMGYGLLRLGFPHHVPSVLLLGSEPEASR